MFRGFCSFIFVKREVYDRCGHAKAEEMTCTTTVSKQVSRTKSIQEILFHLVDMERWNALSKNGLIGGIWKTGITLSYHPKTQHPPTQYHFSIPPNCAIETSKWSTRDLACAVTLNLKSRESLLCKQFVIAPTVNMKGVRFPPASYSLLERLNTLLANLPAMIKRELVVRMSSIIFAESVEVQWSFSKKFWYGDLGENGLGLIMCRVTLLLSELGAFQVKGIVGLIGLSLQWSFGVRAGRSGWLDFLTWSNCNRGFNKNPNDQRNRN